MAYRDNIDALSRDLQSAIGAAADNADVSLAEYGELRALQRRVESLRHKQWQRDTFPNTYAERTTA